MNKVNDYITAQDDWKRENLELFRRLVGEIEPTITEEYKWNVPVFMLNGKMQFAMSAFKSHTKYNFIMNGALLNDPDALFNNGLESKKARSIDLREGESISEDALKALIKSSLNMLAKK